jgi:hypothetical protein
MYSVKSVSCSEVSLVTWCTRSIPLPPFHGNSRNRKGVKHVAVFFFFVPGDLRPPSKISLPNPT